MKTLSRAEVRQIDERAIREFGIPSLVLMENAGRGATDVLCELGIAGPVIICCGKGNNAGDGLVMARHLDLRGFEVRVLHWNGAHEWKGDGAIHFQIICKSGISHQELSNGQPGTMASALLGADWIVDGLLGTGAQGAPRAPYSDAIRAINDDVAAKKFAIDTPSGLDCDTGNAADPTFEADHTCTFVAPKHGLLKPQATSFVGQLHVKDIGVPRRLFEP